MTPLPRTPHAGEQHVLACIDLPTMRGLEIGPLHNPIVWRHDSEVYYVDHADTSTLREKYADDANVPEVFAIDFVWGDRSLAEAVGNAAPFDYVVASHVIEHVPNPVGWLNELADVLRPGGVVSLVVPDQRYCFDARRPITDAAEIVGAYLEGRTRPTLAQIFDFEARYVEVDSLAVWAGRAGHDDSPLRLDHAWERCRAARETDDYIDVHCTTWTPASFAEIMRILFDLGLLDLRIASFMPTPVNFLEFYVSLERLPDGLTPEERRASQLRSLPELSVPPAAPRHTPGDFTVSDHERRLVETKRRALEKLRQGVGRFKPRGAAGR